MPAYSSWTGRSDGAGGAAGSGLAALVSGSGAERFRVDDANQSVRLLLALGHVLRERCGGEGILYGGAYVVGDLGGAGTTYPVAVMVINDDAGDPWPIATTSSTAIDFTAIANGASALYASPTLLAGIAPSMADGGVTALTLVALPAADPAPADSLKIATGTVTTSAFTAWTPEAVFVDDWVVGTGHDVDIDILADNGDGNLPRLRYQSAGSKWQYSHNGTVFYDLPTGSAMSTWSLDGDNTAPQAVTEGQTATVAGTAPISTSAAATRTVTVSLDDAGVSYTKIQNVSANKILGNPTAGPKEIEEITCTAAGRALLDDADAATQRTTLGLGSMAVETATDYLSKAGNLSGLASAATSATNLGLGTGNTPTWAGAILTNGGLRFARDAKCGPPTAGTFAIGNRYTDLLGGEWYCTAAGTPGTWVQMVAGRAAAAPVAGDFNGGALLDGYRLYHTTFAEEFFYNAAQTGWLAASLETMAFFKWGTQPYTGTVHLGILPLSDDFDIVWVEATTVLTGTGTWDGGNYFTIALQDDAAGVRGTTSKPATGTSVHRLTPSSDANAFIDVSANPYISLRLTEVGSTADISYGAATVTFRKRLL